ncbi:hypothetical protein LUZ60_006263 [Juncus effusus]|nr:hypothetical protein LUZ60_006263 [Juncus effusus]
MVPVVPVASTSKKLVFFRDGEGSNFDLDGLLRSPAEVLGKGTFGTSYKSLLDSGQTVVVKRLKGMNIPESQFHQKVRRIGEMKHDKILPLVAYSYYRKYEKLFIYDLMPFGSLSEALHANGGSAQQTWLNWQARAKVILSVSQSINYIHLLGPTFCHGNIKSSNVLLTPTYEARLSNPGLYSLSSGMSTYYGAGGYLAPEIADVRKTTQKADVYSFGVLMLEVFTAKPPIQVVLSEGLVDLPMWVQSFERMEEAFDVNLVLNQSERKNMMQLILLALNCTMDNPVNRPCMADVVVMIEKILNSNDK